MFIKSFIATIASLALMSTVEGRKTYLVKESIERGDLKVHHPRVRADADCEWCVFQDDVNSFCITADEDWTVGFENTQYSQESDDTDDDGNAVYAHFRHGQTYYTTQAAGASTSFYLEKLYSNTMTYSLDSFTFSFKWEAYYFYDYYAWCLNFSHITSAIKLSIVSNSALETCSKAIINCFDNFDTWTSPDAQIFDDCSLSSGTDVTVWEYEPLTDEYERYWFGDGTYTPSMCWPGSSPLYSYIDMYPNNPVYAIWQSIDDMIFTAFVVSAAGLGYNAKAMEGPIDRPSWSELAAKSTEFFQASMQQSQFGKVSPNPNAKKA